MSGAANTLGRNPKVQSQTKMVAYTPPPDARIVRFQDEKNVFGLPRSVK